MSDKLNYDALIAAIADYTIAPLHCTQSIYDTARYCLMDAIGCALLALRYPACTKLLGPIIPLTVVPNGARVIGCRYAMDPIRTTFNNGLLIRWLDFNDTWLAQEWGHPSDNIAAILALTDYLSRIHHQQNRSPIRIKDVLLAMVKAYEIQGILALENSFNRLGFDHVILVKIATAAIATQLLGGDRDAICASLSQALIDVGPLRTYRHAPNTGSRKSWAAGDASARGVELAWRTMQGEMGYPTALSAPKWGLNDVLLKGQPLKLGRPFNTYVMENILFKIAYPAEFHAQTAVEAAVQLHSLLKPKLNLISKIIITTHESAVRIISKSGPLTNPADRDHCLQYMVAVALLQGDLKAQDYENEFTTNPIIDALRQKMVVVEDAQFTADYLDPHKRSIANRVQVNFSDDSKPMEVEIHYPLGHVRRREEGIPLLIDKFANNIAQQLTERAADELLHLFQTPAAIENMPVNDLLERLQAI